MCFIDLVLGIIILYFQNEEFADIGFHRIACCYFAEKCLLATYHESEECPQVVKVTLVTLKAPQTVYIIIKSESVLSVG